MDLMLALLVVVAFPAACLAFVLWMGVIEDSIPAGVTRAVRVPDPPPVLAVPVRRTAVGAVGWWESVTADNPALDGGEAPTQQARTPHSTGAKPTLDGIPEQRTPPLTAPLAGT